jgi:hypothetical protein
LLFILTHGLRRGLHPIAAARLTSAAEAAILSALDAALKRRSSTVRLDFSICRSTGKITTSGNTGQKWGTRVLVGTWMLGIPSCRKGRDEDGATQQ